ncbi:MAG TPA: DUF4124 domain-containing protein [Nitrospiria bacterium]|jgi:hypothetical protein|nr:DUF4124 domain-containing protein [Nitrospiria bacterium]
MIRYFLIIFALFLLFTPISLQAVVYKWLDEQGNVGFTDNPDSIPEKYRQNATRPDGTTIPQKPKTNITPAVPPSTNPTEDAPVLDDQGRDKQWWRARVQEFRHRKEVLLAEKEKLAANTEPLGNLGLGSIEANQQATKTKERLEQIDSEVKEIEYNLTVLLPEEAREANAPPGWLRE